MKNIKVIFRGHKSPSGMMTNTPYMIGEAMLKLLEKQGMFDMEVTIPEASKPKKKKSSKDKGDE